MKKKSSPKLSEKEVKLLFSKELKRNNLTNEERQTLLKGLEADWGNHL